MSFRKMIRSWAAVGAAAAALFGTAAPAGAAVVVASFDPAVGPAIPGVGFRGTAQFFIDDACLSLSGFVSNNDTCSNGTMSVTTANVDFYDLANINNVLASLTFPGSSFAVNAAEITEGEVSGFDTTFANPALLLELNDFIGTVAMRFSLGDGPNFPGGVDLLLCPRGFDCVVSNRAVNVTFTTTTSVPEPGTLALLGLAALAAVGAGRRRR